MKTNMGFMDKCIRLGIAAVILLLFFLGKISGVTATILGIIAGVFILTSLIGYCPLYQVLGFSSCKTPSKSK